MLPAVFLAAQVASSTVTTSAPNSVRAPAAPKLMLSPEQIDQLQKGSGRHAFGAALVVTAFGAMAGGVPLAIYAENNHTSALIPGAAIGGGVVLAIIGGMLYSAGTRDIFHAFDPTLDPPEPDR